MKPLQTWEPVFREFIACLTIDSKEHGVCPLVLNGAQDRYLVELCEGLDRGIRQFTFLKARQLGVSTLSLAVTLFWLMIHKGLQGALVADTDSNRDKFRIILDRFIASLPKKLKPKVVKHNRNNLVLGNGSVLDYLVAGTRRGSTGLGKSRAFNFVWATEVSAWGDAAGMSSLMSALAETHPDRLYLFESTANSFNLFYDAWVSAQNDVESQKAIFIGWWAKEEYQVSEPALLERYGDPELTDQEREQIAEVHERYGVTVTLPQLAWYRWKSQTRILEGGSMAENFPWTEEEAFVSTGLPFFPGRIIRRYADLLHEAPPPFKGYRYFLGEKFDTTRLEPTGSFAEAELKVWEEPVPHGIYAIGCDPAYGRSEWKDRHVIEVWRCYADRMVQVAEFATAESESYQMGWVLAHLAGCYENCIVNLEISGPGIAVAQELRHLKELLDGGLLPGVARSDLANVFGAVRWYLYHRPDSMGAGYVYHWKTNGDNKFVMMNQLRDSVSLGMVEPRSNALVGEMRTLVQDGGTIQGSGRTKDDRVFATGLAHKTWVDWQRGSLIAEGLTWERVKRQEELMKEQPEGNMISRVVSEFFQQCTARRAEAEDEYDRA